jgi:hypothetical protein
MEVFTSASLRMSTAVSPLVRALREDGMADFMGFALVGLRCPSTVLPLDSVMKYAVFTIFA